MKKHYETHVEDTDKLISVAGPILEYKSWYEQYRKLMEEQAQRKYGLYTPTSEGDDDDFPSIPGMIARYSASGLTNEQMKENPVWVDKTGNGHDLQMKNFAWKEGSGISDIYPGALVFDGVDDWAGCDNLPLLPKEKGYSIIALRNWITRYDATQYKRPLISNLDTNDEGAFLIEYRKDENDVTGSYNSFTDVYIDDNNPITWQTSSSYNGQIIKKGTSKSTNKLCICKTYFGQLSNYANAAIWEIVILDHDATEEELTKIKDYFVKTYPWLFPDQAWTVTGKTNEDEDRATIANITGNGNNLVLSNFGFAEGSGYGLYETNFMNWVDSHRATFTRTSSKINVTAVLKEEYATFTYSTESRLKQRIKVTGLPEGVSLILGRTNFVFYTIAQDGIYDIDVTDDSGSSSPIIGYRINKILDSCDITIEQIPEYEGYLVTDGVDDKITSSVFTMGKDFTIVGDWKLLATIAVNAGIIKPNSLLLFNRTTGISLFINSITLSTTISNIKSLKAICSDGRIYLNDWSEMRITNKQSITSSTSILSIGFNGNNYTQVAFKNLGIYDSCLLSKEDCIKSYIYLQTLKAK